jgi:LysM repeat protein
MFLVSLAAKTALAAAVSFSGYGSVTVAPGDTLSTIAAAHGTTWQALYAANRGVIGPNPNLVYAGAQLVLPGGSATATAPTATTADPQPVSSSSGSASGGSGSIPSSFFSCVHLRESTNGQASNNQFGILPSTWAAYGFSGSPYTASYGQQVQAFETIYASVGASAWAPYDGC